MPYDNEYSRPVCSFIRLDADSLVIKNLSIDRDPGCTYLTHIALITGRDDVRITNVMVHTPSNTLTDDRGIRIQNCTNVLFDKVHIDGTYSQNKHAGYGVFLDNIWNFKAVRMYGKATWGIFGTNNINTARIEDSQINRFDIHCYGRDIFFENVDFFDLYNQFSGVYGTIQYDKCTFTDFTPDLNGGSYNAFVEHDLVLTDCVFNVTPQKNFVFRPIGIGEKINARNELEEKAVPNIKIKNMTVNMMEGATSFVVLLNKLTDDLPAFDGITDISIDGLTINAAPDTPVRSVQISSRPIETVNEVSCTLKNVVINQPESGPLTKSVTKEAVLKTNLPVKGGKVQLSKVKNLQIETK